MATTIGFFDLASLKNLRDDVTQYFWFESDSSSAWGSGAHVTLYPESQFTNSTSPNYMKGQNIIMNTDGFSIRNGGLPMMTLDNDSLDFNAVDTSEGTYVTTAKFGNNGAQIGQDNESHLEIDYHSMRLVDNELQDYLYISDLIDRDGALIEGFYGDGENRIFTVTYSISAVISVTINDVPTTAYTRSDKTFTFDEPAPANEAIIKIEYRPVSAQYVKAYTLGRREANSVIGLMSYAEGMRIIASGHYSHAEGMRTIASGIRSHAEGTDTTASGDYGAHAEGYYTIASGNNSSHAEGYYTTASGDYGAHAEGNHTTASGQRSHAEGNRTIASGDISHAEGSYTTASGLQSHAGGYYTIAQRSNQTVIGKYNIADTDGEDETFLGNYALIIGNGTNAQRSNALTVDWDGDVVASGDITCANIGDRKNVYGNSSTSNVNNPAGTYVTIGVLEHVPNGLWIVNCRARFIPNTGTTGNNYPAIYITTNPSGEAWHQRTYTTGTTNAQLNAIEFLELSDANNDNSIYLRGTNNQAGYWTRKNAPQFIIDAIRIK